MLKLCCTCLIENNVFQIARELRLRDIGGIIVVDFIDMADECKLKSLPPLWVCEMFMIHIFRHGPWEFVCNGSKLYSAYDISA